MEKKIRETRQEAEVQAKRKADILIQTEDSGGRGGRGSSGPSASSKITLILQRLFRFSSLIRSAVSVHLRRNTGVTAVAFNKELDPVQKLFVDKIREYRTKRQASGGATDTGPEYQQDLERELFKLKQMYGKADKNMFPDFKSEDPKFEAIEKPQS
ncbi:ATP synthase-coupling factor 6, mitochondrial-like [Leptonychotes weddellii]|uniref:ATP synthase peripheral stalk subunit F6, mitochondrial n=1 Tax=Leptonychotes weddellii TaxID=9713 RepID=A0A2U3YYA1_LEPWE|nr:ATP synthase-coupling factor 6, mitochondrial-like [Leptonychotes weddellii]